jgi:hypothetical protein
VQIFNHSYEFSKYQFTSKYSSNDETSINIFNSFCFHVFYGNHFGRGKAVVNVKSKPRAQVEAIESSSTMGAEVDSKDLATQSHESLDE